MRSSNATIALLFSVTTVLGAQQTPGVVFNPVASPVIPDVVAFERTENDKRELKFLRISNQEVFSSMREGRTARRGMIQSLPDISGAAGLTAYSGELDWRPVAEGGRSWYAYVASDDKGKVGLLLNFIERNGQLARGEPLRIQFDGETRHPRWSPDGKHLAFLSDSSVLHIVSDVDVALRTGKTNTLRATRMSTATRPALFPEWSPFGDHIAYGIETTSRGNKNGAIEVLPINKITGKVAGPPVIVTEELIGDNEYRPSWSPDAKYIAFYVDQSGLGGTQRQVDIGVVEVIVSPRDGRVFRGSVKQGSQRWFADNVIPHEARGPAWSSVDENGSPRPGILYVARNSARNNPIVSASLQRWIASAPREQYMREVSSDWGTVNQKAVSSVEMLLKMRFLYISVKGGGDVVSHHDAVAMWAKGPDPVATGGVGTVASGGATPATTRGGTKPSGGDDGVVVVYAHKGKDVANALLFPGLGQRSAGQPKKALVFGGIGLAGAAGALLGVMGTHSAASDGKTAVDAGARIDYDGANDKYKSAKSMATIGGATLAAAWIAGILDVSIGKAPAASGVSFRVAPEPYGRAMANATRFEVRVPFGSNSR